MNSRTILLVDDDVQALEATKKILEFSGFCVHSASDGQEALDFVRAHSDIDLILSDVRMPKLGGLEFLRALSLCGEKTPVILMTAFGRVEDAVWAMKLGAVDFLTKPFKRQALLSAIDGVLKRTKVENKSSAPEPVDELIVGQSELIKNLKEMISQVAPTGASVLLRGESGTGKELVARLIHQRSARAKNRFVALNCAAIPENLIESELFGFERGAFTGASSSKEGLFQSAQGGTLLLDEIGDMPLPLQSKLLRVLQEREVTKLGSTATMPIDVRVIAATHQDLTELVRVGKFRQDLLYRLEVVLLEVPPLRERLDDIPCLCQYFISICNQRHAKKVEQISGEALQALQKHFWPGNVRELFNVIERMVVFSDGSELKLKDLPTHLLNLMERKQDRMISFKIGTSLRDMEDQMIRKTLEATSGDKNMTAKLLGINSRTIYRKLEKNEEGQG